MQVRVYLGSNRLTCSLAEILGMGWLTGHISFCVPKDAVPDERPRDISVAPDRKVTGISEPNTSSTYYN